VAEHYIHPSPGSARSGGMVSVVAAENFWGSLVAQLGGTHVQVLSIVSDPNADPHEYESNTTDAIAIANARLVIENGAGYDDWCSQLVASANAPDQTVLNVADLLGIATGANPHFWYGATFVNRTVAAMFADLVQADPADAGYFASQYATLNASLAPIWAQEASIDAHWGTNEPNASARAQVASTESIFQYMANSTGLDLVSPYAFMKAVSEGSDPPTQSVTQFQDQLESGNVSVLVYNQQTVTPLTSQMETIATQHGVSIVPMTETIQPSNETFQFWMSAELAALENALNQRVPAQ
jgi:zinc/manganese transport system substrate-binding protein